MEPLLSFYDRVDLQAISVQAAVLKEVTYMKVLGTGAKQTYTKAKSAVKWLTGFTGVRNKIDATPAKSTSELVLGRADFWIRRQVDVVRTYVLARWHHGFKSTLRISDYCQPGLLKRLLRDLTSRRISSSVNRQKRWRRST